MTRILGILGLLLASMPGWANERVDWLNAAETGQFLVRSVAGRFQPAILSNTDVEIDVNGPVAEVTVTQHFRNTSSEFAEGIYVYPLPDNAATHGMDMHIGSRHIVGEIHEREKAREVYRKARRAGKRTGLVEQQRPNLFTTSVANVAPGEEIRITIHYSQVLEREGRRFSLRLPLTLTPRFQPPDPERFHTLDLKPNEAEPPESIPTDIAETARKTANLPPDAQTASVTVRLNPGMPVTDLVSRSHDIRTAVNGHRQTVTLADGRVPMDRDFRLRWKADAGERSEAALFTQTVDGEHYGLLMLMPPSKVTSSKTLRKEQLLVIDRSGSMRGTRIQQARRSLLYALRRLNSDDRFNVLAFNNTYETLFPEPVAASPAHIQRAVAFVRRLDAGGGTEMLPVLRAALAMPQRSGYLRQVIFATDGAISNENALFALASKQSDGARLFPVGIGSAPNSFLMRRLAAFGRGTHTFIGDSGEVEKTMSALLDRIARPVLSDIELELPEGVSTNLSTERISDLYVNEPLVVAMKFNRFPRWIRVRGKEPRSWSRRIPVNRSEDAGVARLWARDRIRALMAEIVQGGDVDKLRSEVVTLALKHRLASRYTSFVAVDRTPVRQRAEEMDTHEITPRLPNDMATVGRGFPKTALDTGLQLVMGLVMALLGGMMLIFTRRRREAHGSY